MKKKNKNVFSRFWSTLDEFRHPRLVRIALSRVVRLSVSITSSHTSDHSPHIRRNVIDFLHSHLVLVSAHPFSLRLLLLKFTLLFVTRLAASKLVVAKDHKSVVATVPVCSLMRVTGNLVLANGKKLIQTPLQLLRTGAVTRDTPFRRLGEGSVRNCVHDVGFTRSRRKWKC